MYLTEQIKPQKAQQTPFQKSDSDEPGLAPVAKLSCGRRMQWEDFYNSSEHSRMSRAFLSARLAVLYLSKQCIIQRGLFATPHAASEAKASVCVSPCKSTGQSKSTRDSVTGGALYPSTTSVQSCVLGG